MDLVFISTTITDFQFILFLLGGLAFIMAVISFTVLAIEFDGNISDNKQIIAVTLIFALLSGIAYGVYKKTDEITLYHYVVDDFHELDEKLETHEIHSIANNVHKLIKK